MEIRFDHGYIRDERYHHQAWYAARSLRLRARRVKDNRGTPVQLRIFVHLSEYRDRQRVGSRYIPQYSLRRATEPFNAWYKAQGLRDRAANRMPGNTRLHMNLFLARVKRMRKREEAAP